MEHGLLKLTKENEELRFQIKKQREESEAEIHSLKVAYDNKLSVFLSSISIDRDDEIKSALNQVKKDSDSHRKLTSKLESKIDTLGNQVNEKKSECREQRNAAYPA